MRKLIEQLKTSKRWNIILWSVMCCFLLLSLLGIQGREEALRLRAIEVLIEPREELAFLDSNKVLEIIKGADTGRMLIGAKRNGLMLDEMEGALERYPFIEKADVSIDLSGKLIVKVLQRNPVLRIISNKGNSYYVAKNGYKMPLHPGFAPRVLVANGNIAESLTDTAFVGSKTASDLLLIAAYCNSNPFWHSQIEQLYVDNYMDILLIPKVGNHSIVFGSADHLEKKFEMLKTFYHKGLNATGWDKYKSINLKYEGQIVAGKKENATNTQIIQP